MALLASRPSVADEGSLEERFLLGSLTPAEAWAAHCEIQGGSRSAGAACDHSDRDRQVNRLARLRTAHWIERGPEQLWHEVSRGRMSASFASVMHCKCFTDGSACASPPDD